MSCAVQKAVLPLVEPVVVKTIYADGLGEVVVDSGRLTYVYYADQPSYYAGNGERTMERIVVCKITMLIAAAEEGREMETEACVRAKIGGVLSAGEPPPMIGETRGRA